MTKSRDAGEDLVGRLGPHEWSRVRVRGVDALANGLFKFARAAGSDGRRAPGPRVVNRSEEAAKLASPMPLAKLDDDPPGPRIAQPGWAPAAARHSGRGRKARLGGADLIRPRSDPRPSA